LAVPADDADKLAHIEAALRAMRDPASFSISPNPAGFIVRETRYENYGGRAEVKLGHNQRKDAIYPRDRMGQISRPKNWRVKRILFSDRVDLRYRSVRGNPSFRANGG
jgi:hypothetical protein